MRALALLAVLTLFGCAANTTPTTSISAGPTPSPSPTASPTATPEPSPSPSPSASPTSPPSPSPSPLPTATPTTVPTASPSPSPVPTLAGELSPAQVRYLLMDNLGPLHYCDPDLYPVATGDEQQKAIEIFPTIQADPLTFAAILERAGLTGHTTFTDADKLQIYREWKTLQAVQVQPLGNAIYSFDVTTEGDAASGEATHYTGTVDATIGSISIVNQEQVFGVSCPI